MKVQSILLSIKTVLAFSLSALMGCQSSVAVENANTNVTTTQLYSPVSHNVFPREEKYLRQWDTATVADLDQDGYPDLLLNDHGFSIRVMWNNQGKYAAPYDLLMGDAHGISVGDFNKDGQQDIILSRGGGSGSNARNAKMVTVSKDRQFTTLPDFAVPLEYMRGRTVKFIDLDNDGFLDLVNFAFPSNEKKGKTENYLYKNDGQGNLVLTSTLPAIKGDGQKTLLTDFNHDQQVDLVIYGRGPVTAYQNQGGFKFTDVTDKVFPQPIKDVTSIAEIDYDNDGDLDLFFTRGHEFTAGETFYNSEKQLFGFYSKRGQSTFDKLKGGDIVNINNLQTQWPNKTLFVGESAYEYAFPGETHSGRDIRMVNSDALGFPDSTDEKGVYIGYIGNKEWQLVVNTWSPATGVIQGIKAAKESKHAESLTNIMLNNDQGVFSDVSGKVGLERQAHSTSVAILDVNNDGFSDLVVRERGDLVNDNHAQVYLNQYGQAFERQASSGVVTTELGAIGLGIEPVDFDLDGRVDLVLGDERGKWHLMQNTSAQALNNDFIRVDIGSSKAKQASALGAMVYLTGCNKSQMQRIGATSAAYSFSFNPHVQFGVGQCAETHELKVVWPTGEQKTIKVKPTKQTVTLQH
ncbi:CRTAC1 family protein [Algibacillus agarilyticus]|uniref:CRTAC1 family protein n=1 Tax=Algibacillus agarilyticus TaxID=2234133 RepID=UPI001E3FA5EF|nr:CRTAC1 family protein [Algibacillus agarilyticus]